MWSQSYSKTVEGVDAKQIWNLWANVNQWVQWQEDLAFAQLQGEFKAGAILQFQPKGGPKFNVELLQVEENSMFADLTNFPLAKMTISHEMIPQGDGLEIKTTVSIRGPLSFLWRKLVVEGIAKGMAAETEKLIEKARTTGNITV